MLLAGCLRARSAILPCFAELWSALLWTRHSNCTHVMPQERVVFDCPTVFVLGRIRFPPSVAERGNLALGRARLDQPLGQACQASSFCRAPPQGENDNKR